MERDDDIITEALRRYRAAVDADREHLDMADDDLRFAMNIDDHQWPAEVRRDRDTDDRAMLSFNKMGAMLRRTVGGIWQNKPTIKVRPNSADSNPKIAEILEGRLRHIETISNCDIVYALAAKHAAASGRAWCTLDIDYVDDTTFDQEIFIRFIPNSACIAVDPNSRELDYSDAEWFFISDHMDRTSFEARYGKDKSAGEWENGTDIDDSRDWFEEDRVRIARYYRKKYDTYMLYQFVDASGAVVVDTDLPDGITPIAKREVRKHRWVWSVITGREELEGPHEWPGKFIPLFRNWGSVIHAKGQWYSFSLIRDGKDAQRLLNFIATKTAEMLMLAPEAPWIAEESSVRGRESQWDGTDPKPQRLMTFKGNPALPNGGKPERSQPAVNLAGYVEQIQICNDELRTTVGVTTPNFEEIPASASGRALSIRRQSSDQGSAEFPEMTGWMLLWIGRAILDLIPKVHNGEGAMRIKAIDGSERFCRVNHIVADGDDEENFEGAIVPMQIDGALVRVLNPLDKGVYDCVLDTGPAYPTRKQEGLDLLMTAVQSNPSVFPVIADVLFKYADIPMADELMKRFKALLPPQVQALMPHDDDEQAVVAPAGTGNASPAEIPDPASEAQAKKILAEAEKICLEAEKVKVDIEKELAEIEAIHRRTESDEYARRMSPDMAPR